MCVCVCVCACVCVRVCVCVCVCVCSGGGGGELRAIYLFEQYYFFTFFGYIQFHLQQVKRSFSFVAVDGQTKLLFGLRRMHCGSQL